MTSGTGSNGTVSNGTGSNGTRSGGTAPTGTASGPWREHITVALVDVVLPIAVYYGLRAAGVEPVWALVLGAGFPLARIAHSSITQRRIDGLALFVLVILALSLASLLFGGSPRTLLAKDAWLMAACGVAVLVTLWRTPVMFTIGRLMLRKAGHSAENWDEQWRESPEFRRVWRVLTVLWGATLIADAGAQVLMAYTLPIDVVPVLTTAQWIGVLILLNVISQIYLRLPSVKRLL